MPMSKEDLEAWTKKVRQRFARGGMGTASASRRIHEVNEEDKWSFDSALEHLDQEEAEAQTVEDKKNIN